MSLGCERQQLVQLSLHANDLRNPTIDQGVKPRWRRTELAAGEVPGDVVASRGELHRPDLRCSRAQLVGFELDSHSRSPSAMLVQQREERIQRFREQAEDVEEHAVGARGIELADDGQRADVERGAELALMPSRIQRIVDEITRDGRDPGAFGVAGIDGTDRIPRSSSA